MQIDNIATYLYIVEMITNDKSLYPDYMCTFVLETKLTNNM